MEWEAEEKLLLSILSKRGEQTSPKGISELVKWARNNGHLREVALIFSVAEWREVGDHMWDSMISDKREEKTLKVLGPVWRDIFNSLKYMQAERQVAAAAVQALSGPATATTTNLLDLPTPGVTHLVHSTAAQVRAAVELTLGASSVSSGSNISMPEKSNQAGEDAGTSARGGAREMELIFPEPLDPEREEEDKVQERELEDDIKTLTERLRQLKVKVRAAQAPPHVCSRVLLHCLCLYPRLSQLHHGGLELFEMLS